MAFADLIDLSPEQVAKMVCGFGGGVGRQREVCGAVSAMAFVLSNLYGYANPKDFNAKKQIYADIQECCNKFREENGSIVCRELLGLGKDGKPSPTPEQRTNEYYKKRPCAELVECSAKILDEFIKNKEQLKKRLHFAN